MMTNSPLRGLVTSSLTSLYVPQGCVSPVLHVQLAGGSSVPPGARSTRVGRRVALDQHRYPAIDLGRNADKTPKR